MYGLILIVETGMVKPAESADIIRSGKYTGKQGKSMFLPLQPDGDDLCKDWIVQGIPKGCWHNQIKAQMGFRNAKFCLNKRNLPNLQDVSQLR